MNVNVNKNWKAECESKKEFSACLRLRGLQPDYILNAALVSVLPSVINWLNPNYERYGKVK